MRFSLLQPIILLVLSALSFTASSQTTLSQGDLAIIGFNANGSPKSFSFVVWVKIENGTVIKFTDNGFNGPALGSTDPNALRAQEQIVVWTSGSDIAAGTVISITGNTATLGTVQSYNANGLTTTGMSLGNSSGDQIFAFQGATPPQGNEVTFRGVLLFGLTYQASSGTGWLTSGVTGSFTSYLPIDLSANNQVYLAANATGGQYNGSRTSEDDINTYRMRVTNPANWQVVTGSSDVVALNSAAFTSALPVSFGTVEASLSNERLLVKWHTLSEINNDRFEVQVSTDGQRFNTIKTVATKASGGNSNIRVNYEFSQQWNAVAASMVAGFCFLFLLMPMRKKRIAACLGLLAICCTSWYGCGKKGTIVDIDNRLYVRIAQVDKDGHSTVSKVVSVRFDR